MALYHYLGVPSDSSLSFDCKLVEAVRFNGHTFDEDPDWLDDAFMIGSIWRSADGKYRLNDSSTNILAELKEGDYVIRQPRGQVTKLVGSVHTIKDGFPNIILMIGDKL